MARDNPPLPNVRDRYAPAVQAHMPGCDGLELQLRCSLLLMRDRASARLRAASEEASGILREIEQLVTAYAFRSMPLGELNALRWQLVRLTACASGLESFADRLSGGQDARG